MDQDQLQLAERAIANAVDFFSCHAIIMVLTRADWLKCPRLALDKLYQWAMLAISCRTRYAPASCYLCCSIYVAMAWCCSRYGLSQHSILYSLALMGALDFLRRFTPTPAHLDE